MLERRHRTLAGRVSVAATVLMLLVIPCHGGTPTVEVEEPVYVWEDARNGAGPLWCYGSTCIVRSGREVFVSGLETIPGQKPLNNVRWVLYRRTDRGWEIVQKDEKGRTREPCPLAVSGRDVFLSANPTLTDPDAYNGPSRPEVLRFRSSAISLGPEVLLPEWPGRPAFTEHSYRGFAADGRRGELLLMNIVGHEAQYWSFRDRRGRWSAFGRFEFPMGVEYEKPEPIRLCYPVLAVRNRAAHVLAISDIVEPVRAWREFKRELTGREWDYDFRRLFYAWTPDITRQGFGKAIEVASREATCGHIINLDMWLETPVRAHLLWREQSVWHPQMRNRFFPGTPITVSLETAVVERGQVVRRKTLATGGEGADPVQPQYARYHVTPSGRLYVVAYFSGTRSDGASVSENRLMRIGSNGEVLESRTIPLQHPFTSFMTATERAGNQRSRYLEMIGTAAGAPGIRYARIRVE